MKTNATIEMACQHLESIGCDGNAIELRKMFAEHAAMVAVAETGIRLEEVRTNQGRAPWEWEEAVREHNEALAQLAAIRKQ
jgi:hypothetical protein